MYLCTSVDSEPQLQGWSYTARVTSKPGHSNIANIQTWRKIYWHLLDSQLTAIFFFQTSHQNKELPSGSWDTIFVVSQPMKMHTTTSQNHPTCHYCSYNLSWTKCTGNELNTMINSVNSVNMSSTRDIYVLSLYHPIWCILPVSASAVTILSTTGSHRETMTIGKCVCILVATN